jgi:hypothetical protein
MDCCFCNKKMREIKNDWNLRKFHKICWVKHKDILYVNNLVNKYKEN